MGRRAYVQYEIGRYERYLLQSNLANLTSTKKMRNGTSALGVLYMLVPTTSWGGYTILYIVSHGVGCALLILGEGNARA